ncbi:MAG: ABC transporter substrate-binding protein [Alphaproteobacteria bacterium]|nr:ABC transporter substrate-binding protein [Alphaproteobacteria bacterium]
MSFSNPADRRISASQRLRHIAFAALLSAGAVLGATPADAQRAVARLGFGTAFTAVDPHYHNQSTNFAVGRHLFDPLIARDADGNLVPGLATAWRAVDDLTWEIDLRRDVRFHNGDLFTAEDVLASVARPRAIRSPSSYAVYLASIDRVEVVDTHKIRIVTKVPNPSLPIELSLILIINKRAGGDASTDDFNKGSAAVGTGPFRFKSYAQGERLELERNDSYWGARSAWSDVTIRVIASNATRVAALLSNDVDLIEAVPPSDLQQLRRDQRVRLWEVDGTRLIFIAFQRATDQGIPQATGPNGEPLPSNPMADLRVRQALSLAINRQAIVERIMDGAAVATGQLLPQGSFGYNPEIAVAAFDPERARALLREAGYPNGFRLGLVGPNNRYINDERILQAVAQAWQRIGVQTNVQAVPWSAFLAYPRPQLPAHLQGALNTTGEASGTLRVILATPDPRSGMGTANRGSYSNRAMDELLRRALVTIDDAAREALLRQATRLAMDDVAILPLFNQKNIWASRTGFAYAGRRDELTLANGLRRVE